MKKIYLDIVKEEYERIEQLKNQSSEYRFISDYMIENDYLIDLDPNLHCVLVSTDKQSKITTISFENMKQLFLYIEKASHMIFLSPFNNNNNTLFRNIPLVEFTRVIHGYLLSYIRIYNTVVLFINDTNRSNLTTINYKNKEYTLFVKEIDSLRRIYIGTLKTSEESLSLTYTESFSKKPLKENVTINDIKDSCYQIEFNILSIQKPTCNKLEYKIEQKRKNNLIFFPMTVSTVKILLDIGERFTDMIKNYRDIENMSLLVLYIYIEKYDIAKYFIDLDLFDLNPTDSKHTPLTCASYNGNLEIVKLLVEKKAMINMVNTEMKSPLYYSFERKSENHQDISRFLFENGASMKNEFFIVDNNKFYNVYQLYEKYTMFFEKNFFNIEKVFFENQNFYFEKLEEMFKQKYPNFMYGIEFNIRTYKRYLETYNKFINKNEIQPNNLKQSSIQYSEILDIVSDSSSQFKERKITLSIIKEEYKVIESFKKHDPDLVFVEKYLIEQKVLLDLNPDLYPLIIITDPQTNNDVIILEKISSIIEMINLYKADIKFTSPFNDMKNAEYRHIPLQKFCSMILQHFRCYTKIIFNLIRFFDFRSNEKDILVEKFIFYSKIEFQNIKFSHSKLEEDYIKNKMEKPVTIDDLKDQVELIFSPQISFPSKRLKISTKKYSIKYFKHLIKSPKYISSSTLQTLLDIKTVNGFDFFQYIKDYKDTKEISMLVIYLLRNNPKLANILISENCFHSNYIYRNTPLHIACSKNYLETVSLLIQKNQNVNSLNSSLCSPLLFSTFYKNESVSKLLIEHGASPYKEEFKYNEKVFNLYELYMEYKNLSNETTTNNVSNETTTNNVSNETTTNNLSNETTTNNLSNETTTNNLSNETTRNNLKIAFNYLSLKIILERLFQEYYPKYIESFIKYQTTSILSSINQSTKKTVFEQDNKLSENKLSDNKLSENKLSDNKLSETINILSETINTPSETVEQDKILEIVNDNNNNNNNNNNDNNNNVDNVDNNNNSKALEIAKQKLIQMKKTSIIDSEIEKLIYDAVDLVNMLSEFKQNLDKKKNSTKK